MISTSWLIVLGSAIAAPTATATVTSTSTSTPVTSPERSEERASTNVEPGRVESDERHASAWPLGIELHAFVSQGFIKTTDNNYLVQSLRGSPDFTEVGLNLTKPLTENLRAGMQLFARRLGSTTGNFAASFDWFYLDYRFADWLGVRAGRTKLAFGLYNDSSDVDSARAPILLPQSIYPIQSRDFFLAQNGGEIYGYLSLGAIGGGVDYRLYAGTSVVENNNTAQSPYDIVSLDTSYVAGGRVMWDTPFAGLRGGFSLLTLKLNSTFQYKPDALAQAKMVGFLPQSSRGEVRIEIPATIWIASLEYATGDLLLAAEYSRWDVSATSDPAISVFMIDQQSERFYGLASYRITTWLEPAVYASVLFPFINDPMHAGHERDGRERSQYDYALSLRFDINDFWLFKAEAHYMRGTALLDPAINHNNPLTQLVNDWVLVLAKTTVYF